MVLTVRHSLWAAGLFGLALLLVYQQTALSMVAIWSRSDTFAHGFLILPISLWLVWILRERIVPLRPSPSPAVLLLLVPGVAAWILATLVDVAVVQQLAMVGILIVGAWAVLGHRLAAALAFPLGFLFFAVPIGEGLIEPMMEFTATTTVWLIRATGIPVYREGLYFSLPTGHWSVVEACSGVRYIIASITVGTLFAYLNYVSWWRRGLFFVAACIVPVFANTARAYIIVMLGHMSNMEIATGADHLVYGWVFFGVVIFILFWLGSFFREESPPVTGDSDAAAGRGTGSPTVLAVTCVLALGIASLGPAFASRLGPQAGGWPTPPQLPPASSDWVEYQGNGFPWQAPARVGGLAMEMYARHDLPLALLVQYADGRFDIAEVVGSNRFFAWEDSDWKVVERRVHRVRVAGSLHHVEEAQLRGPRGNFVAWSWYQVGTLRTVSDYRAKIQQGLAALGMAETGTWRVLLVTPAGNGSLDPGAHMQDFLSAHGEILYEALRAAASGKQP